MDLRVRAGFRRAGVTTVLEVVPGGNGSSAGGDGRQLGIPARARLRLVRADGEIDPERAATIRRRLREGSYDAPEVLDEVVRRILESGDLM